MWRFIDLLVRTTPRLKLSTPKSAAICIGALACLTVAFSLTETIFRVGRTIPIMDANLSEPNLRINATTTKLASRDAVVFKAAGIVLAANSDIDLPTTKPNSSNIVAVKQASATVVAQAGSDGLTPQANNMLPTKPGSDRNAKAIANTLLAGNWQYWQYCHSPSHAEHKTYFSTPIPVNGPVGEADIAFDRMLNKAGLRHDEIQCPRAPNKPTLLFRQKYAFRFNNELGYAVVTLNWGSNTN
jgi:hypothetical protein